MAHGGKISASRESNLELLRIFAMLLIVLHHFSVHGTWPFGNDMGSDIAIDIIALGGKIGVNLFVLITGYFLINSRFKLKSIFRVYLQTLFYSVIIGCSFVLINGFGSVTGEGLLSIFFPICFRKYWFVTAYVGLMFLTPFIRVLADSLSKRAWGLLLCVAFFMFSVLPTFVSRNLCIGDVPWFVFVFLIAGYIRRFGVSISFCKHLLLSVVCLFLLVASCVYQTVNGGNGMFYAEMDSVFVLVLSVEVFLAFRRMNIGSVRAINLISSGAFGVYLIHDNSFFSWWLWPHFEFAYDLGPAMIVLVAVLTSVLIYLVCSVLDLARKYLLEKPFMAALFSLGGVRRFFGKVDDLFNFERKSEASSSCGK